MVACGPFVLAYFDFIFFILFHIVIIWYICIKIICFMAKVVHVHLLNRGRYERKDYYFASISAIYTVLTAQDVGATKGYLLHAGLSGNGSVATKCAIIKQSTLIRGTRRTEGK